MACAMHASRNKRNDNLQRYFRKVVLHVAALVKVVQITKGVQQGQQILVIN